MPQLYIEEEYGYRRWVTYLTNEEHADLVRRWQTMKNLSCLVPVRFVVPQAREATESDLIRLLKNPNAVRCHIHEADDSWLEGCDYKIPYEEGASFEIDGDQYDALSLWNSYSTPENSK